MNTEETEKLAQTLQRCVETSGEPMFWDWRDMISIAKWVIADREARERTLRKRFNVALDYINELEEKLEEKK